MFSFLQISGTCSEFQDSLKIDATGSESLISILKKGFPVNYTYLFKNSSNYCSFPMCLTFLCLTVEKEFILSS